MLPPTADTAPGLVDTATSTAPPKTRRTMRREARAGAPAATGWHAWLELTKPKIVQMMLVTCASAMVIAEQGLPDLLLFVLTMVGLGISIGGASALNHVLDRDLDERMARTRRRPIASGTISVEAGTAFGLALFLLGGAILCLGVNALTAWCALVGGGFYVAVYTPLKRFTSHNTVIGGVAGAMPPVVGWAAMTDSLASPWPWALFGIMFAWQPAHFWPLSLLMRKDYAAAGFKMLPVTHGEATTDRATWRCMVLTLATTLIPFTTGDVSWIYGVGMVVANVYLTRRMWALVVAQRELDPGEALVGGPDSAGRIAARNAFLGSLTWLAIIFVALLVDSLV
ncbi:MAG: protoheme farnesyltransferase [Thermoleophilia bacterium]|nr:protoheme farnesyltransferase [Thermoleophilia bacterium]